MSAHPHWPNGKLLPHHAAMLEASAIPPDVVLERGYRSVRSKAELGRLGFGRNQLLVPTLLVPVHDVRGAVAFHQHRPDEPRIKNGKTLKYETPAGARMTIDVPPRALPWLGDLKRLLVITEGAKKADAAVAVGLCCIALLGVWNWRGTNQQGGRVALADWEAIALAGRDVYLIFDSDVMDKESVHKSLERLKRFLEGRQARVRIIYLEPAEDGSKVGLDDYLMRHKPVELLALATDELRRPTKNAADLPEIVIATDIRRVVDQAEAAILASSSGAGIYQRGRMLVHVVRDAARRVQGLSRPPHAPVIEAVSSPKLTEEMASAAMWVRPGDSGEMVPALPPKFAVDALAARGQWSFRPLEAVVETPTLRPDGSVLETAGYDPATGILFMPGEGAAFPPVPGTPTMDQVRAAVDLLKGPLSEFPFLAESDRSSALAAMLTVSARTAIDGPAPMFAVRAVVRGAGKGLLCDVISLVGTGRRCAVAIAPREDDEVRKLALSIGIEGTAVVLLDNVEGTFGSAALAAALTATEITGRLLGANRTVSAPLRPTWLLTGNNVAFRGDLGRRVLPIDLDPGVEYPEDRTDFEHPDLLEHVLQERPRLVVAALTILRGFVVAGRPAHGRPRIGSFYQWDDLVRAALIWAGEPDPCAGRERIREDGDADRDVIGQVLHAWHEAFTDEALTVRAAVGRIKAASAAERSLVFLRDVLRDLDGRGGSEIVTRTVSIKFRYWKGRIVAGLRLEMVGKEHQSAVWRVVLAGPLSARPVAPSQSTENGESGSQGSHVPATPREGCGSHVSTQGETGDREELTPLTPLTPQPEEQETTVTDGRRLYRCRCCGGRKVWQDTARVWWCETCDPPSDREVTDRETLA